MQMSGTITAMSRKVIGINNAYTFCSNILASGAGGMDVHMKGK
jgi:hypothetical protein